MVSSFPASRNQIQIFQVLGQAGIVNDNDLDDIFHHQDLAREYLVKQGLRICDWFILRQKLLTSAPFEDIQKPVYIEHTHQEILVDERFSENARGVFRAVGVMDGDMKDLAYLDDEWDDVVEYLYTCGLERDDCNHFTDYLNELVSISCSTITFNDSIIINSKQHISISMR